MHKAVAPDCMINESRSLETEKSNSLSGLGLWAWGVELLEPRRVLQIFFGTFSS